jgi:uncharacterized protein
MPLDQWPIDRRSLGELAAVLLTGLAHVVVETAFHAKGYFIAAALAGWGAYLIGAAWRDRGILRAWGLRVDNLARASVWPAVIFLIGAGLLAIAGAYRGTLGWNAHLPLILAIYPVWGIAQQFMLQAMVVRNLRGRLGSAAATTAVAALLFGAVHLPDLVLSAATLLLGIVFVPLFLRYRNVLPLGVVHGWLGALAYYWLLGRDPYLELFG